MADPGYITEEERVVFTALGFDVGNLLRKKLVDPRLHGGVGEKYVLSTSFERWVREAPPTLDQATVETFGCAVLHTIGRRKIPDHLRDCRWLPYLIARVAETRTRAVPNAELREVSRREARLVLDELDMAYRAGGTEARTNLAEAIARGDW